MSSPQDLRNVLQQGRLSRNRVETASRASESAVQTRARAKAKAVSGNPETVSTLPSSVNAVSNKRSKKSDTRSNPVPRETSRSPPILFPVRPSQTLLDSTHPSVSGKDLRLRINSATAMPSVLQDDVDISLYAPSDPEFDSPVRDHGQRSPTLQERKRQLEQALADVNAQVEQQAQKRRRVAELNGPGFPRSGLQLSDEEDAEVQEGLASGPLPQGPEVPWREIIALGRHLHGLENPVQAPTHPVLLGDKEPAEPMAFPLSHHVEDAIKKAFCTLAGNDAFDFSLPLREFDVTSKDTSLRSLSTSFDPVFHVDENASFSAFSSKPSPEESALLRDSRRASHSSTALSQIESLSKRSLLSLSTLNWLLGSLQKADPVQHAEYIPTLWWFITRVLMSSMELSASVFGLSLQSRRLMFLNACDPLRVPDHLKPWLALRSPFARDPRPPLLGGSLEECRTAARENREVTLLSSLTARSVPNPTPRAQQKRSGFQNRRGNRARQQYRGRQDSGNYAKNPSQGQPKGSNPKFRGGSQKPRQKP